MNKAIKSIVICVSMMLSVIASGAAMANDVKYKVGRATLIFCDERSGAWTMSRNDQGAKNLLMIKDECKPWQFEFTFKYVDRSWTGLGTSRIRIISPDVFPSKYWVMESDLRKHIQDQPPVSAERIQARKDAALKMNQQMKKDKDAHFSAMCERNPMYQYRTLLDDIGSIWIGGLIVAVLLVGVIVMIRGSSSPVIKGVGWTFAVLLGLYLLGCVLTTFDEISKDRSITPCEAHQSSQSK